METGRTTSGACNMAPFARGVRLKNETMPMYLVSHNFTVLNQAMREYEIENTVKWVSRRVEGGFNQNKVPWEGNSGKLPPMHYYSVVIPQSLHPHVKVSKRVYGCRFGTKKSKAVKTSGESSSKKSLSTCKIGCPCRIIVEEVIKFTSHKCTDEIRLAFQRMQKGKPSNLAWVREFHMIVPPLNSHIHATGEAAGPNMPIDSELRNRIRHLVASGIVATDIIQKNLEHHVENVMFQGRNPPLKNNRRFYPQKKDITNTVRLAMLSENLLPVHKPAQIVEVEIPPDSPRPESPPATENNVEEEPTATVETENDLHALLRAAQYAEIQRAEISQTNADGQVTHVIEYPGAVFTGAEVVIKSTLPPKTNNTSETTGTSHTRSQPRDAKQSFEFVLNKLTKVGNILENDDDLSALTASLVDVMLKAKPMIPRDQLSQIYQEEPRKLQSSGPRRIRKPRRHKVKARPRAPPVKPEDEVSTLNNAHKRVNWTEIYNVNPTLLERARAQVANPGMSSMSNMASEPERKKPKFASTVRVTESSQPSTSRVAAVTKRKAAKPRTTAKTAVSNAVTQPISNTVTNVTTSITTSTLTKTVTNTNNTTNNTASTASTATDTTIQTRMKSTADTTTAPAYVTSTVTEPAEVTVSTSQRNQQTTTEESSKPSSNLRPAANSSSADSPGQKPPVKIIIIQKP